MDAEAYIERLGADYVSRRMVLQADYVARVFGPGRVHVHFENILWAHALIRLLLQATGLYRRGQANARTPVITHNTVRLPGLPRAYDGFKILHLSDLHADFHAGVAAELTPLLARLDYDLAVMTGDYRTRTIGNYEPAICTMQQITAALKTPAYAVLGNHDFLEMAHALEQTGIRVLINEHEKLTHGNDHLYLAGVDDPHFYRADDLSRAVRGIPPRAPLILLCHSPDIFQQAAQAGVKLMLCGHTHGGQICLPGGIAILRNSKSPRALLAGPWHHRHLQGYTSRGLGTSGVDVRYFCPPEIVIHHLTC